MIWTHKSTINVFSRAMSSPPKNILCHVGLIYVLETPTPHISTLTSRSPYKVGLIKEGSIGKKISRPPTPLHKIQYRHAKDPFIQNFRSINSLIYITPPCGVHLLCCSFFSEWYLCLQIKTKVFFCKSY